MGAVTSAAPTCVYVSFVRFSTIADTLRELSTAAGEYYFSSTPFLETVSPSRVSWKK